MKYIFNFSDYKVTADNNVTQEIYELNTEEARLKMNEMLNRANNSNEKIVYILPSDIIANYIKHHINLHIKKYCTKTVDEADRVRNIYKDITIYLNKSIGHEGSLTEIFHKYGISVFFIDSRIIVQ